jgi:hypothetical protein
MLAMAQGFVYILLNPSFPDQIKIGRTEKGAELRAKQLQTTGVPTPFILIYDELVSECEMVEHILHVRFAAYRTSADREFFRIPIREAIRVLQEVAAKYKVGDLELLDRVDILSSLEQRYGSLLKADITSVQIIQLADAYFLEVTRKPYAGKDQVIERIDLWVFGGEEGNMFPAVSSINMAAHRFLNELDDYDLIMAGVPLFTPEGCSQIAEKWEQNRSSFSSRSDKL